MSNRDDLRWGRVRRRVLDLNITPEELVQAGNIANVNFEGLGQARNNSIVSLEEPWHAASIPVSPIVVEDEDDEVQVCSPRSFNQAKLAIQVERAGVVADDDLQLRLGPTGNRLRQRKRIFSQISRAHSGRVLPVNTIDLTSNNDDTQKVKAAVAQPMPIKEVKFTCAICYDTMEDETSTVCGHVFCWKCIHTAVATQKRCPTCRRKLTNSLIHRLYLSGNMR
ncbi:hypothetical protein O6H91_01G055300 [Diphasiastrum complanatum]|uniref:Uncharacterized protein n=1 Tax=Diphasiastrum complanatum TaxID=34168 RepID=A0ACC2ERC9_DIPCM|nr:hypothetical protein O6H91_01G055300 [Diphasiastrum complanatum]